MKVVSFSEWMVVMGMLGPGDTGGKLGTSEIAVRSWPFKTNANEGK